MQVTIEIPDELAAEARRRGLTPEGYVRGLIEEAAQQAPVEATRPKRDMEAFFKAMAANSDKIPELPDEAFTRESFYQDHD
jgi:hypothetical protein